MTALYFYFLFGKSGARPRPSHIYVSLSLAYLWSIGVVRRMAGRLSGAIDDIWSKIS
jgi:hypothetical protein